MKHLEAPLPADPPATRAAARPTPADTELAQLKSLRDARVRALLAHRSAGDGGAAHTEPQ